VERGGGREQIVPLLQENFCLTGLRKKEICSRHAIEALSRKKEREGGRLACRDMARGVSLWEVSCWK